jgi:hypothetical protein
MVMRAHSQLGDGACVFGSCLDELSSCYVTLRFASEADISRLSQAASRRGTANAIHAKDVPAKVIEKPKKWTQKLSDEVIRVISAAAENPEDEVTFTAPPKGVIGLVPDPDEQEGGVLAERLEELEEEMGRAVKELRFEDAAKIRDEMVQLKCPPATTRNCQEGDSMFDWEEDKSIPGLVQGFEWAQEGEDAGFDWVDAEKQKKAVATKVAVATRLGIGGGNKPSWTPPADMLPNDSFDSVMRSGRRSDARDAEVCTLYPEPWTVDPEPWTLDPGPWKQDPRLNIERPTPYTLHHTPYTPYTPYTIHAIQPESGCRPEPQIICKTYAVMKTGKTCLHSLACASPRSLGASF